MTTKESPSFLAAAGQPWTDEQLTAILEFRQDGIEFISRLRNHYPVPDHIFLNHFRKLQTSTRDSYRLERIMNTLLSFAEKPLSSSMIDAILDFSDKRDYRGTLSGALAARPELNHAQLLRLAQRSKLTPAAILLATHHTLPEDVLLALMQKKVQRETLPYEVSVQLRTYLGQSRRIYDLTVLDLTKLLMGRADITTKVAANLLVHTPAREARRAVLVEVFKLTLSEKAIPNLQFLKLSRPGIAAENAIYIKYAKKVLKDHETSLSL